MGTEGTDGSEQLDCFPVSVAPHPHTPTLFCPVYSELRMQAAGDVADLAPEIVVCFQERERESDTP